MSSPYREVLGPAFERLHPRLRAYFDALPSGSIGRGRGVFDTVGTPRRRFWPLLALFADAGVLFPVWQRGVPFTVENRPAVSPAGRTVVRARRVFHLRGGSRVMQDEIGMDGGELVDRLGSPVRAEAWFGFRILDDGGLRLVSRRVALRVGGRSIPIPRVIAPVIALTERFDDEAEEQSVSIVVGHPLLGRLYQYAGTFTYEVSPGE